MLAETLSNLLNAAVVAGAVGYASLFVAADSTAPMTPAHNAYSCVRPFFLETSGLNKNGSFVHDREFAGFLPCRETLPTDDKGFVVFPEA